MERPTGQTATGQSMGERPPSPLVAGESQEFFREASVLHGSSMKNRFFTDENAGGALALQEAHLHAANANLAVMNARHVYPVQDDQEAHTAWVPECEMVQESEMPSSPLGRSYPRSFLSATPDSDRRSSVSPPRPERDFFIDNLLVRIHHID